MTIKRKLLHTSLGLLAALATTGVAGASSHREAPAISLDPAADNTDLYAWVTPGTHDKMYIVANYIPLEEPSGGPNFHKFDDDVRYEIHIARGPSSLDDVVTYEVYFKTKPLVQVAKKDIATNEDLFNGIQFFSQIAAPPPQQTYTILKRENGRATTLVQDAPVAPPNIGPRTDAVVYKPASGTYDDAFAATFTRDLTGGGRVWAGPRDDGFYVDLGGIFDLANITSGRKKPVDGVAGYNVHSIVFEIPTTSLTGTGKAPKAGASDKQTLGVWAAASRRRFNILETEGNVDFGGWVQVSRLGLPLINEAVIGLEDKDRWNRMRPKDDLEYFAPYFLNPVVVRNAAAVGIYKELGVDDATVEALKHGPDGNGRTDIIDAINLKDFGGKDSHAITSIGDVLRVDLGIDSGFPNGRPLVGGAQPNQEQNDVTDTLLTLLLSGGAIPISDHVSSNDKPFLTTMPFLALPWQGFDQGHGKAAM
ncbi:MAG TPA: DUF4331 domain-containing protein [Polyangiaceae bacterium]|jgi:hypothetical protein|nr:DUF4331 domain-containing protein [Polyangiaceae bacterium]